MDKKLHKKLKDRIEKGTLRSLSSFEGMIDFGSNDYLGLAKIDGNHPVGGSTGSRLITGHTTSIDRAEESLASFFESEAALCFNSGYDANVGLFSAIPQRGDVVLYDEHIHASVRDGIRLGLAKAYSFKHNDVNDLQRLLENNKESTCYIAIEALYSMNGDFTPLLEIIITAKEYKAYVILDEAHSAGVFGLGGRGFAHGLNLHDDVFIRLVTFGKAYGSHGAVVLCDSDVKSFLVNFARSIIYTTALPSVSYQRMMELVQQENLLLRRNQLQENIAYFREGSSEVENISASNSPIQIVRFESVGILRLVVKKLQASNIFAKAIYAPTVPIGSECLRIGIHSFNTIEELSVLCDVLNKYFMDS